MIVLRQIIASVAILIGAAASCGYAIHSEQLKSWSDGRYEAIRPTTIAMTIAAGLMIVLMAHPHGGLRLREFLITSCGAFIGGVLFANVVWSFDSDMSTAMPSIGTHVAAVLLAAGGWLRGVYANAEGAIWLSRLAGAIGGMAVVGFILGLPALYWSFSWSTGMSIPVSVALMCLAVGANGRLIK